MPDKHWEKNRNIAKFNFLLLRKYLRKNKKTILSDGFNVFLNVTPEQNDRRNVPLFFFFYDNFHSYQRMFLGMNLTQLEM